MLIGYWVGFFFFFAVGSLWFGTFEGCDTQVNSPSGHFFGSDMLMKAKNDAFDVAAEDYDDTGDSTSLKAECDGK